MWLDKECFTGKLPRSWDVFLCFLALALEILQLTGKVVWKVAIHSCIADERVNILTPR
jgi:hypothetical protein